MEFSTNEMFWSDINDYKMKLKGWCIGDLLSELEWQIMWLYEYKQSDNDEESRRMHYDKYCAIQDEIVHRCRTLEKVRDIVGV